MGRRGPVIFGMLLSLSFFSGLLTLLLLSQTTSPIPPASQLPRIVPDVEGPAVVGSPRGDDPLEVPFPVLVGPGGLASASTGTTATEAGSGGSVPGLVTGLQPPADGEDPAPGPGQPPVGTLPRQEPDEDEDAGDRHDRDRGKGHDKARGKGHDHDQDVADAGDDAPKKERGKDAKAARDGGGKIKSKKK